METFVRERHRSHAVAARTASLYYLADRKAERSTWPVPRFASAPIAPDARSVTVPIELDEETWKVVAEEAERQRVSAERLIEHAVLYFLADLDSGRIAGRLDEVLEDGERH